MSAVKKYCNKAVLIENGLVKAYGEPFDVAGQYQLDNTHTNTLLPHRMKRNRHQKVSLKQIIEFKI